MTWKPAPCGVTLSDQLDARYGADRPNDGTIASAQHSVQNPTSDHEIDRDPDGGEWVDARDVYDWQALDANAVMHRLAASQDRRIKYVISHGEMCSSYPTSRYPAWTWRPYSGPNGHFKHGHISFVDEYRHDTSPWDLDPAPRPSVTAPPPTVQEDDDMAALDEILLSDKNSGKNYLYNVRTKVFDDIDAPTYRAYKAAGRGELVAQADVDALVKHGKAGKL